MVVGVLYYYIGPSVLAGVVALLLLVPLNSYVAGQQQRLNRTNLKYKDERLRLTNEVLTGMKVGGDHLVLTWGLQEWYRQQEGRGMLFI